MKQESIREFNEKVELLNKDLGEYYNQETGVKFLIPTSYLWARVDYLELTNDELKKERFNQNIDNKDIKFNYIESTRPVPKYEITKRKEDENIITDAKVKVNQVWLVTNGLKYKETFNNKEEALKVVDSINEPLKALF